MFVISCFLVFGLVCYLYGHINSTYQWVNCAHNKMLMRIKDKVFFGKKKLYQVDSLGYETEE